MAVILSFAIVIVLLSCVLLATRWRNVVCTGSTPVPLLTFLAILFTSGLDVGLIMFPLVDFEVYASEAAYDFANPLAVEFGFWGFLVWASYFLTTFYFCVVEPKLKLFEIPAIKWVNNVVIIGTCAFTAYLFLIYLPSYIEGISSPLRYALVATIVFLAVLSSTNIRFVKVLSVASTALFFVLIATLWFTSGMGISGLAGSVVGIGGYFENLHRFVMPITDYHQFYLYWWLAWSIMIGQFVSQFVGSIKSWQLLMALLIVPSIPIAIWFSVLYYFFAHGMEVGAPLRLAMILVGVLFVLNSLDSLIRLYTQNLEFTVQRIGGATYLAGNWLVLVALVALYQLTPLKIEWFGLAVIGIYAAVYTLCFKRRRLLLDGVPG